MLSTLGTKLIDHRNIKSKEFKINASRHIISCLADWGFPQECRPIHHSPPNTRLFKDMMVFFMNKLCPEMGTEPFEKKISENFVLLGYPNKISATHLKSPTSPHTWPIMLAALDWLCGCVEIYFQMMDSMMTALKSAQSDKLGGMIDFDRAWKRAHRTWTIEGETAGRKELNDQLGADTSAREDRILKLQVEYEGLVNQLKELDKEQPSIRALKIELESAIKQKNMALAFMQSTDSKIEKGNMEVLAVHKSIENYISRTEDLKCSVLALRKRIASQPMTIDAAISLNDKIQSMKSEMTRETQFTDKKKWRLSDEQKMLAEINDKLFQAIDEFNQKAGLVLLIPETARFAQGQNFRLQLKSDNEILQDNGNEQVNQWKYLKTDDLTNIPTGATMTNHMQRVHSEITSAIRELQPQVDKMKAHNQKKKVEISQNERQVGFIKDDIQCQREQAEEYRKKAGEIVQANKRLGNEDTQAAADKELLESEVHEFQEVVEVAKANYESAEKAFQAERKRSEKIIGDQKEQLCEKMAQITQICYKIAKQDMDSIDKLFSSFSG